MDPDACQALCVAGCHVSGSLGAALALAVAVVTSALAAWATRRERVARAAVERERAAVERERARADFWRARSVRPPRGEHSTPPERPSARVDVLAEPDESDAAWFDELAELARGRRRDVPAAEHAPDGEPEGAEPPRAPGEPDDGPQGAP